MEKHDKKPPFWKLAKSIMPEDTSEEDLPEATTSLHEFMLLARRMQHRLESEGKLGDLHQGRKDIEQ